VADNSLPKYFKPTTYNVEAAITSFDQIFIKLLASHPSHMKSLLRSFLKTALLLATFASCFTGST